MTILCTEDMKEKYTSGQLFKGHILEDYIVPIFNIPNLEGIMVKANIMTKRIRGSEKGTYYSKIFPINTEPLSHNTIDQVVKFAWKLKGIRETNILEFVEYCIEQIPNVNLWEERS